MDCSINLKIIKTQNVFIPVYVVKSQNKYLYSKREKVSFVSKKDAIDFGKKIINEAYHCGYLPV